MKLLIKRVESLTQLTDLNNPQKESPQENYNYDNNFSKDNMSEKIIEDSGNNEDAAKHKTTMMSQLESELNTVALDWKSFSKVEECVCLTTFDAFNEKVDERFFFTGFYISKMFAFIFGFVLILDRKIFFQVVLRMLRKILETN